MSCPTPAPTSLAEDLEDALQYPYRLDLTRTLPGRIVWQARCCLCGEWLPDADAIETFPGGVIPYANTEAPRRCAECADKATRHRRTCSKCGEVISAGHISFTNIHGEFCGTCWPR